MNKIFITKNDREKLITLINNKFTRDDYDLALLEELGRAEIVESEKIPGDVITMNSQVNFTDINTKTDFTYWLVFPQDADISQNKISVLSPVGCALLGYKIGDVIELKTPQGEKNLLVEKILHQPESKGIYE